MGKYVRIREGLYKGDLAKIVSVRKKFVEVAVVPRIDAKEVKQGLNRLKDKYELGF